MAATLKLRAEGFDELACWIEHKDRRMILLISSSFVNHVQVASFVDGHIMSRLPGVFVRQLSKRMVHAKLIFAFADNGFFISSTGGRHGRS